MLAICGIQQLFHRLNWLASIFVTAAHNFTISNETQLCSHGFFDVGSRRLRVRSCLERLLAVLLYWCTAIPKSNRPIIRVIGYYTCVPYRVIQMQVLICSKSGSSSFNWVILENRGSNIINNTTVLQTIVLVHFK